MDPTTLYGMKPIGTLRTCRLRRVNQLIHKEERSWNETGIQRFFHQCDVEEILRIRIPFMPSKDVVAWNFELSGSFSIRSAYRLATRLQHDQGTEGSSS